MHPEILRQRRILPRHGFIHRIRHVAIRDMPCRRSAQLGNVNRLGKVHLEQRPLAERQRNRILRILLRLRSAAPSQLLNRRLHPPHRRVEPHPHPSIVHVEQHLVPMLRSESLHDLNAPPVPVHVAKPARIHQNVEAELLSRTKSAQHFVMLSAMPQPQVDNLPPASLARDLHCLPNLPIRVVAMLIQERRRDFYFERLFIEQIDDRLRRRKRLRSHQLARRLPPLAPRIRRRISISYPFGSAYFTKVGAPRPSRSNSCSARAPSSGFTARICSTRSRHESALTLYAAPVAAFFSDSPRTRTSLSVCESRCATCVSSVRALTISPSEVFVASGSR